MFTIQGMEWLVYTDQTSLLANAPGLVDQLPDFHTYILNEFKSTVLGSASSLRYNWTVTTPPGLTVGSSLAVYDMTVCVVQISDIRVGSSMYLVDGTPSDPIDLTLTAAGTVQLPILTRTTL